MEIHANYVKLIIRAFVDTTMVVTDTFFGVSLRQPPPKYDWEAAVARWREKAERMPAACRDDNYCDDGDRCTTDICDKESKVCRHERVQCLCDSDKEVAECDSKTGQCMITEKKEKTTETVPEKPADVAVPDVPAEPQTAAPSPKQIRDEEFARLRAELKRMPADHKPDGYSDDVELCNAEVCYTELGTCRQALIPCSYNYITEDAYCDPTTGYCTITKKEKSDDGVVPEKTETVPAEKTIVYPPVRAVSDCVPGHDSNCESGIKYADGYVPPATVA